MTDDSWLNEVIVVTLTRKEIFDLANAIADGCRGDVEFTKIRDRSIRKIFRRSIQERHRLWVKVINSAERKKGVKK